MGEFMAGAGRQVRVVPAGTTARRGLSSIGTVIRTLAISCRVPSPPTTVSEVVSRPNPLQKVIRTWSPGRNR